MTPKHLYDNITIDGNPKDILSVEVSEAYKQTCARCSIEVANISGVALNSAVGVDLGYDDNHATLFEGYVDQITTARMPGTFTIECRDILKRAIEHYIVSGDLENPWSRENISAEALVGDLLEEAGITNYSGDTTSFTFGTQYPAEFNLISSWDGVQQVCHIIAWHCYAKNGMVYFKNIRPVPSGAATHTFQVGNAGDLIQIGYNYSTDNLRNKCICFGKDGIYAEASAESPHLPAGFYKTAIVSSELIDIQSMADQSVQYNLDLYNKLTESFQANIEGNPSIRARDTVHVTEPFTGQDSDWFVYSIRHRLDVTSASFTTAVSLTK